MKDFRKQYKDGKNEEVKYWRIFNRNQNANFIQSGDVRNGKIRIGKTIRYLKNKIDLFNISGQMFRAYIL
jgi:hypothetical protein